MVRELIEGKAVTLSGAAGVERRVLVKNLGDVLLVCRQEEYDEALRSRRDPVTIGVRLEDVVADRRP